MREKVYVDRLFAGYEDTPEIRDFKEEITGNLKERVKELMSKGLSEDEAFDKATAELGDITAIADDLGKKKRNEAIGQMYMNAKVPITKKTALGLTLATGLLLLGAAMFIINYFSDESKIRFYYLGILLISDALGLYVYSGLTQESVYRFAMKNKRALMYGVIVFVGVLGEGLATVLFFFDNAELAIALGIEFALVVPAVCALVFLVATGSNRDKPWVKARKVEEYTNLQSGIILGIGIGRGTDIEESLNSEMSMVDPVRAARFGVISGGLWVLAAALFVTFGLFYDWGYALLVFLFAAAAQVLMVSTIFRKRA
ncbi:MAG: permease prefix domain 1-containing protein [Methanomassiliicoccaceae archaeon]|nr:permease prefix domain 1-containing protein [Methanomassiliicoccaceae archaeon]